MEGPRPHRGRLRRRAPRRRPRGLRRRVGLRLLLDTHVVLWALADHRSLSRGAKDAIADPENRVAVSAATAWEISIKRSLGRLGAPDDLEDVLEASGFETLPITVGHALAAGALPAHHRDPFDRMLVAQALDGSFTLMTHDQAFARYGVPVLFV
ncbi:MAG: type II toxin-antitoxin system VapC family toxin [Actinomycetota bacterium]